MKIVAGVFAFYLLGSVIYASFLYFGTIQKAKEKNLTARDFFILFNDKVADFFWEQSSSGVIITQIIKLVIALMILYWVFV